MRPEFKGTLYGFKITKEQFEDIVNDNLVALITKYKGKTNDNENIELMKIEFFEKDNLQFINTINTKNLIELRIESRSSIISETLDGTFIKYHDFH
jgi:hypothetical protein